jgi:hypothetical protein
MKPKKPPAASRVRKVLLPRDHFRTAEISFSDERWARIRSIIPSPLSSEHEKHLRKSISDRCNRYLGRVRLLEEGTTTAAAVRRGGGKQAAPLERLISSLKTAATVWAEIRTMHDDHRGVLSDYGDRLADMAADAERRLEALRALGESKPMPVKSELVRGVAECCRGVGLNPTATGRVSQHEKPTWFQKFMVVLNNEVLGDDGWGLVSDHKARAVHSYIAKQGIPRK